MTDIDVLVNDAKAPGTFSVTDAIKERSYPQDIVSVYTDVESAYLIHALERLEKDETDVAAHEARVAEIDALKEKVKNSVLTFRLRGIGSGTKRAIRTEAALKFPEQYDAAGIPVPGTGPDYGPGAEWHNAKVLAAHIVDVTDIDGNVDSHMWTVEEIEDLQANIPEESFAKILDLMFKLSFAAAYFDASVTPDFS